MAKIVNVCLYGPVTDGWSYQDNLLTKYQKLNGNDVTIITSKWVYNTEGKLVLDNRTEYLNENGIKTIRLDIAHNKALSYKFKRFVGLKQHLEAERPEILFVHNCQFLDIYEIVKYLKKHPGVKVYVDNHSDFSNSATNWFSKNILHRIVWRSTAKAIEPYVQKFWGVIPARVDFLHEMYGIPKNKIGLLVMGIDDEAKKEICTEENLAKNRKKYGLQRDDFVIVTGGKIDKAKVQILCLMESMEQLRKVNPKVKLIIFGSIEQDLKDEFDRLLKKDTSIIYTGFVNSVEAMLLLKNADLAVFPGRHSVYWEETVGLGTPLVVKYWKGTTHINVGGNVEYLKQDSIAEIQNVLTEILENPEKYRMMKQVAESKGVENFSYRNIALKSIT